MRFLPVPFVIGALAIALAPLARADDDVRAEIEALKRQVREQERRIRELEGTRMTRDDVAAALDRYLDSSPPSATLVGGEAPGRAGWPTGKRAFLEEGPNRLEIGFRSQIRSQAFLYSSDARAPSSDERPKDRSGFEVETLLLDLQGTVFCPSLTWRLMLNFDSDSGSGVEKRWAWLDWRYAGDHHVRAGQQKVAYTFEEVASAATLMFVDRNLATRAFGLNYDTGVALWGTFGDLCEPKRFRYTVQALTGEGRNDVVGSVFADATDKFSDQLLYVGSFEWNLTGKDWGGDEVDNRCGEARCRFDASVGVSAYAENDDDANLPSGVAGSLALKGNGGVGPLERRGWNAWFRAQWRGFSLQSEWFSRHVNWTAGSTAPDQDDRGWYVQAHYRFPDSPWGVGAKYAVVLADDDHFTDPLEDTFREVGFVLNYFLHDHAHKVTFDAAHVEGNSGVSSAGPGYLASAAKGVAVEDGWLLRLQWQVNF